MRRLAPSKTFLVGEYAVLQQSPAVLMSTGPHFEAKYSCVKPHTDQSQLGAINMDSPTGRYLHDLGLHGDDIHFVDPHQGKGGFGASTAQFLLAYLSINNINSLNEIDHSDLLNTYRTYHYSGKGLAPSGADLIGQLHGQITVYYPSTQDIRTLRWPFPELRLNLLHTGNKVATHEHLASLSSIDTQRLTPIIHSTIQALETADQTQFLLSINAYANALQTASYTHPISSDLLDKLEAESFMRAAKPCGALGADVLLVITDVDRQDDLLRWCADHSISFVADDSMISDGAITTRSNADVVR